MRGGREAEGRRDVGGSRGGREEGKKRQTEMGKLREREGLAGCQWLAVDTATVDLCAMSFFRC